MKKLLALLLVAMVTCASCTALPAEERAFAVALCVERHGGTWRVRASIPTYQSSGGYQTVSGEGDSLSAALADMDASAPMHVTLSQLRLLILDAALGSSGDLKTALTALSDRADVRMQCTVAVTEAASAGVMEALEPAAGTRLSKSIELLTDTRIEQGAIPSATLADVLRMGERQSPVLAALTLADGAVNLSGGYPADGAFRLGAPLTPEETALLALMTGGAGEFLLRADGETAAIRDGHARAELSADGASARVEITLHAADSTMTTAGLERAVAEECLALLTRLYAGGCDALGLGRQAIRRAGDMAAWHEMDWAELCRGLQWTVAVRAEGAA